MAPDPEMEPAKVVVDDSSSSSSSSSSALTKTTSKATATATSLSSSSTTATTKTRKNKKTAIEYQRAKSTFRYVEDVSPGLRLDMELHSVLHASISEVQSIQVIETCFGKTLVTDGKTQSSAHDECVYHESLVHPAMFWCAYRNNHRRHRHRRDGDWPRSVFIGGGELATAREVLRHSTVNRVVMVDIDPTVVDVCRAHLPEWGGDAVLDHPRLEYVVGDALSYVRDTDEKFDVIIMDVTDPIEYGPAEALYNVEFYIIVRDRLEIGGVFVTQAGSASFVPMEMTMEGEGEEEGDGDGDGGDDDDGVDVHDDINDSVEDGSCLAPIRNTLARVFDHAIPYTAPVPSFGEDWGYVISYDDVVVLDDDDDDVGTDTTTSKKTHVADVGRDVIDDMIEERIVSVPGVPDHASIVKGRNRRDGRLKRRKEEVDGRMKAITTSLNNDASSMEERRGGDVLRHYDGIAHGRLFALSKPLRESIMDDDRVMTEANPIFMY